LKFLTGLEDLTVWVLEAIKNLQNLPHLQDALPISNPPLQKR
jgi:hypothetical protein